jgi:hypothetical protein
MSALDVRWTHSGRDYRGEIMETQGLSEDDADTVVRDFGRAGEQAWSELVDDMCVVYAPLSAIRAFNAQRRAA